MPRKYIPQSHTGVGGVRSFAVLALLWLLACAPAHGETYDIVLSHGRVMDPESDLDGIRNVGIIGGKIRAISADSLTGKQTIEARGLVVAPGFIDLHEHGQDPRNYQFQAHDGVTTSLELEVGTDEVAKWYAARQAQSLISYAVSAGHIPMRIHVMTGQDVSSLSAAHTPAAETANHREVTEEE